jgi:hypothetical protein
MDTVVSTYLSQLEIGDPRMHENMTVFPLFHKTAVGPDYITLEEAIEQDLISVEEVSDSGSVPDLKVTNKSPYAVLLLGGEEVAGAKQNRLINTTILIRERSETVIPVSCSEMGRWAYSTLKFAHSGHLSSYSIRSRKMKYVYDKLKDMKGYRSDQSGVWADVAAMHLSAGTSSPTGAMKDMYEQKAGALKEYAAAFECLPGQRGCAVCLGGEVIAVETVSSEDAFRGIFGKIMQSFAVEALWRKDDKAARPDHEAVEAFIHEVDQCREARYESVGEGYDFRYEGKGIIGSILVVGESVVHSTIFRLHQHEDEPRRREDRDAGDTDENGVRNLIRRLRRERNQRKETA